MYIAKILDKYYGKCLPDTGWVETYNPHTATAFKTKSAVIEWFNTHTTFGEYVKPIEQSIALLEFDNWLKNGMVRRTFEPLSPLSRPYNNESPIEVLKWWAQMIQQHDAGVRMDHYKTWPRLHSIFKCIFELARYSDNTISAQMRVTPDTTFQEFEQELTVILPYITREERGKKVIEIFDRFLSEYGNSMYFHVTAACDSQLFIFKDRWRVQQTFSSLEKAFEWWQRERYYE